MIKRKWLTIIITVLMVLAVSACGNGNKDTDATGDESVDVAENDDSNINEDEDSKPEGTPEPEENTDPEEPSGTTKVHDYRDEGEVFFDYPESYSYSDDTGMATIKNQDETLSIMFDADVNEADVQNSIEYFESYSSFEGFRQEELTIAGYDALRIYFIGDWGDYEMSTLIKFGDDSGLFHAFKFYAVSPDEELLSDPELHAIMESIRLKP